MQPLTKSGRTSLNNRTRALQSRNLALRTTLTAADDGTGVTHATAGGSSNTGDEGHDRLALGVVGFDEFGRIFFGGTTDFTNHDDAVGFLVVEEDGEGVDEVGAGEGITTDT